MSSNEPAMLDDESSNIDTLPTDQGQGYLANQQHISTDQFTFNLNLNVNQELGFSSSILSYSPPIPWSPSPVSDSSPANISDPASTTNSQEANWTPIYHSNDTSLQVSMSNGTFTSRNPLLTDPCTYQTGYNTMNTANQTEPVYARLNSIDEYPHFDSEPDGEYEDSRFESPVSPLASTPGQQAQSEQLSQDKPRTRQPAWGWSRGRSNSSSTSTSTASAMGTRSQFKRRQSADSLQLSPTKTSTTLKAQSPRLRSISRNTSRSSSIGGASSSATNSGLKYGDSSSGTTTSKSNHNQIEKQYRNRLNSQFESLLSTLPRDNVIGGEEREDEDGGGVEAKRVSKAEVLILAEKYIKRLERERSELRTENEALKTKVGELRQILVEKGGVLIP